MNEGEPPQDPEKDRKRFKVAHILRLPKAALDPKRRITDLSVFRKKKEENLKKPSED